MRTILLSAFLLILSSTVLSQGLSVGNVSPIISPGVVPTGQVIAVDIRFNNNTSATIRGATNGFRIYSSSGATWGGTLGLVLDPTITTQFDGGFFLSEFSLDGSNEDTIGFGGFSLAQPGISPGYNQLAYRIEIGPIPHAYDGGSICIDSTWYPFSNPWEWADNDSLIMPSWSGPYCYTIQTPDADGDGLKDPVDNCPSTPNPLQEDNDLDDIGDVCDPDPMAFQPQPPAQSADINDPQTGDLDRDLNVDIVWCGSVTSGLYVAWGISGGGFETGINIASIIGAGINLDYINEDNLIDIAAATADSLYVIMNIDNRNFTVQPYPLPTSQPSVPGMKRGQTSPVPSVSTGYFNGDEFLDILVSPNILFAGTGTEVVTVMPAASILFDASSVCDANNDGIDDLGGISGDSVKIAANDGSASYTQTASLHLGSVSATAPRRTLAGDFNGDGNWDLGNLFTYADSGFSALLLAYGNGNGAISDTDRFVIGGVAYSMEATDPNKDGFIDIIVTNGTSTQLEIFAGSSTGFHGPFVVDVSSATNVPLVSTALDQDRDGNTDFVTGASGGGELVVVSNTGNNAPILADEMYVTAFENGSLRVTNPSNLFISRASSTVAGSSYNRFDVDGDGKVDEQTIDYNVVEGDYKIIVRPDGTNPSGKLTIGVGIDGSQSHLLATEYSFGSKSGANAATSDSLVLYFPVEDTLHPTLLPIPGWPTTYYKPTFDWRLRKDPSATKFDFQIDDKWTFETPLVSATNLTAATYIPTVSLGKDSVFYWRYREFIDGRWSEYSHHMAVYIDPCCIGRTGNANGDIGQLVNVVDVTFLVAYLFQGGAKPPCLEEADVNISGTINVVDLTSLVAYLFQGGPQPQMCR